MHYSGCQGGGCCIGSCNQNIQSLRDFVLVWQRGQVIEYDWMRGGIAVDFVMIETAFSILSDEEWQLVTKLRPRKA